MNYPLKPLAEWIDFDDRRDVGAFIRCPNCRAAGSVWFQNPIDGGNPARSGGPQWSRTGGTFETMSLSPSIMMHGHYHGWVHDGELCVDSPFYCQTEQKSAEGTEEEQTMNEEKPQAAPQVPHPNMGAVGELGAIGDLGSNAAPPESAAGKDPAPPVPEAAPPAPPSPVVAIAAALVAAGYPPEEAETLAESAVKEIAERRGGR